MEANARFLGGIFEAVVRMVVPLFQRPYVWKEEDNWEPLWESLITVLNRRETGETVRPHFLGAIVLEQLPVETGEVDVRQVIDGQQRLITLQIVIAAIRDICAAKGLKEYEEAFKRLSENYDPSKKYPESVYKVWPTNVDREHFKRTMNAGSPDKLAKIYGLKQKAREYGDLIPKCYSYFYAKISEWLDEENGSNFDNRIVYLYNTIRKDLILVVVDLGEGDDPQLIFETLNALGTELLPADLVKNFLFYHAEHQGSGPDIVLLYEELWKPFDTETAFWRKEIRQGRIRWYQIDLFLAHYLTLLRKDVVIMTSLFQEFREYYKGEKGLLATEALRQIRKYADIYKSFGDYSEDSREGLFFNRLEALDTNTVIPVLMELLSKESPEEERAQFLDFLESYLVRRAICCFTYKNYNRMFVDLLKHLLTAGFTSDALAGFLLSRKGESTEWPTDDQFKQALCEYPAYLMVKHPRIRMVLEAIEYKMQGAKTEKVVIRGPLTIEHIMPVNWREKWPFSETAGDEEVVRRDETIHRFGNLTLLNNKLNPAVSDASWADKKPEILRYSALAMNRELQYAPNWDESTIEARGKKMADMAISIWPRPSFNGGSTT